MEKPVVKYRKYQCSLCGEKKDIQTNHDGDCYDYCPGCSWKAFWKGEENSIATPVHRHSRLFNRVTE